MRYLAIFLLAVLLAGCAAAPMEGPAELRPGIALEKEEYVPPTLPVLSEEEMDIRLLGYLLNSLTAEERVGQLFLARCPEDNALEDLSAYHLGGYLLFGQDLEGQTPQTLTATLDSYQQAADLPLLIAVDEEGGIVTRVSCFPAFRASPFLSPRNYFASGGMAGALTAEEEKAQLLKSLGIHVNLGPVCDLSFQPGDFMYQRSLGQDAAVTGAFIASTVEIYSRYQLGSVLKHFPGYGSNQDTHLGFARDGRTLDELEDNDLLPFQAGIEQGCGAIMVGHTIYEAFDPELPASLSPRVHQYLRQEMGFAGVIMTDDLQMQAISDLYGPGEAAVLAVLAGNDLLCCTDYAAGYEALLEAVSTGRIPQELLDEAVLRVLKWKFDLGILFP